MTVVRAARRGVPRRALACALLLALASLGSAQPAGADKGCAVRAPSPGQVVRGHGVVLAAEAPGADRVVFSLDGVPLGEAMATGRGWRNAPDGWDSPAFVDGEYVLQCTATYPDGAVTSPPVPVTVDNPVGCEVRLPAGDQPVSGTQVTLAAAHRGAMPRSVEYYRHGPDGVGIPLGAAEPTGLGWVRRWDSTGVDPGAYRVTCVATTADGARSGSPEAAPVTVDNLTPRRWRSVCLDRVPAGPADYQAMFDHREDGWAGADGAKPIPLPDGRIVWLFGDTYAGRIDADNALLAGWRMPNNSVQIQTGACLTPVMGGDPGAPRSFLPGQDGEVFWPSDGYVDTSVSPPVVRLVASRIRIGDCGWFRVAGVSVLTLSLPDLRILADVDAPYDQTAPDMPSFGGHLHRASDVANLYGSGGGLQCGGPAEGGAGTFVARVAAHRLGLDPWEYWDGEGWTSEVDRAAPLSFDGTDRPQDPWLQDVTPYGDGWLATGKLGPYALFGPELYAWTAATPVGPWQLFRGPDGEPVNLVPTGQGPRMYYGGQLVTTVPGTSPAAPMLVHSTNALGCRDVPCTAENHGATNVMLYGPHFSRPMDLPPSP